jgi:hypothetical protein
MPCRGHTNFMCDKSELLYRLNRLRSNVTAPVGRQKWWSEKWLEWHFHFLRKTRFIQDRKEKMQLHFTWLGFANTFPLAAYSKITRVSSMLSLTLTCNLIVFFFHLLYSPLGPWPLLFQFYDHFTDGRTPWTSDQLVARPLPKHRTTQTQNKHIHKTSMFCVGFEPTIPAFEWAKTVHALGCSATVTG